MLFNEHWVSNRICNWETRFLSKAGKTCLLKAVSNVVSNYTMNCLKMPGAILNELDAVQSSDDFGGDLGGSSSRGVCLRKWSDLCSPIKCGGLGIRPLSRLVVEGLVVEAS